MGGLFLHHDLLVCSCSCCVIAIILSIFVIQVAADALHPFLDVPQTHWGVVSFANWTCGFLFFFFLPSFVSSVEEKSAVFFDSWTRKDCNLICPSVHSGNIMNKQHFRWFNSEKMFPVSLLSGFWKLGNNIIPVVVFCTLLLKSE